jgi:hypothetical protein
MESVFVCGVADQRPSSTRSGRDHDTMGTICALRRCLVLQGHLSSPKYLSSADTARDPPSSPSHVEDSRAAAVRACLPCSVFRT